MAAYDDHRNRLPDDWIGVAMQDDTAYDWDDPNLRRAARWMGFHALDPIKAERKQLRAEIASDPAFTDIVSCLAHARHAGKDVSDPNVLRAALTDGRLLTQARSEQWLDYAPLTVIPRGIQGHPPIVYYARQENLVKIGTTSDIKQRLRNISTQGLVAIEPGDSLQETARHGQFDDVRRHGEWFEMNAALMDHVMHLRNEFERRTTQTTEAWLAERLRATKRRYSAPAAASPTPAPIDALLTGAMAAKLVGVSHQNFYNWAKTGKVVSVGVGPDGRKLYRAADVLAAREVVSAQPSRRRKNYRHVA